jgi:hypothetical protein
MSRSLVFKGARSGWKFTNELSKTAVGKLQCYKPRERGK